MTPAEIMQRFEVMESVRKKREKEIQMEKEKDPNYTEVRDTMIA